MMKLCGLQFPIGREKTHALVAGVLYGYDGVYHLGEEQDLSKIIAEAESSLESYNNHTWLTQVVFRMSQVDHDGHNYDKGLVGGVPEYIVQGAAVRDRLASQSHFQQDFNKFIELLHIDYQDGDVVGTADYLSIFANFLGWSEEGPPIAGLSDALITLSQAAKFNRDRGVRKAELVHNTLNDLVVDIWPRTIFLGIPRGPNEQHSYKGPLDYETIARDVIERTHSTLS